MILAKDLITLLSKMDSDTEIIIYIGARQGLHCTAPNGNPCGWIEIGNTILIPPDSNNHLETYPVYTGDDVALCPRCGDQDVLPKHRICNSCTRELMFNEE